MARRPALLYRLCRSYALGSVIIIISYFYKHFTLNPSLEVLRPDFLRSVWSYYVGFDNPSSSSSSSPHRDRHHLHGHHRSQRLPLLGDEQSAHVPTPVTYLPAGTVQESASEGIILTKFPLSCVLDVNHARILLCSLLSWPTGTINYCSPFICEFYFSSGWNRKTLKCLYIL